jgi:para-aminobenzoate synthetase
MRTLLIDNYDSYTYNLFQLMAGVYGVEPVVVHNDDPSWPRLSLASFDAIVISPGPGHPRSGRDFGHSAAAARQRDLPVLGVCLGHQGIGLYAGAEVRPAPEPKHGHVTRVRHTGTDLFADLPQQFAAVRYHSLCVAPPLPASLIPLAWAECGVIMGLRHRTRPLWGVQFHPESVCTEYGAHLLTNFRDLAMGRRNGRTARPRPRDLVRSDLVRTGGRSLTSESVLTGRPARTSALAGGEAPIRAAAADDGDVGSHVAGPDGKGPESALRAHVVRVDQAIDTENAFLSLYGTSEWAFWLDSARAEQGLARFSFLGEVTGPDGEVLTYRVDDDAVLVRRPAETSHWERGTIFDALERRLNRPVFGAEELPFDLTGGYVGYFGYELKGCLGSPNVHRAETPDAIWMRADHLIVVDHADQRTYVLGIARPETEQSASAWAERTADRLRALPAAGRRVRQVLTDPWPGGLIDRWLTRSPERYLTDIAECQRQLRAGESYEICLTNRLRLPAPDDDLDFYLRLRQLNPAPYAAILRFGNMAIMSSSPERFLRVHGDRTVESKPIKGTAPRVDDPVLDDEVRRSLRSDAKTRAENLMIVDLLRNDLGRVCAVGSVRVPLLMATETYATVHQLVSTIRGRLRPGTSALDCVRAAFPGGSMTGAPKLRTMEIIGSLETEARGVYSGALGYLGFNDTADLSIVIRTAVRYGNTLSIGAGGAIVLDSDAVTEYEEMAVKAHAVLQALPLTAKPFLPPGRAEHQTR